MFNHVPLGRVGPGGCHISDFEVGAQGWIVVTPPAESAGPVTVILASAAPDPSDMRLLSDA